MSVRGERMPGRRKLLALSAGLAIASILAAAAATLGGSTIAQIGAENSLVTGFDGGVTIAWGQQDYDNASSSFVVEELTLTPTDPATPFPSDHVFDVVVAGADGSVLGRARNVPVTSGEVSVALPGRVPVEAITRIAISLQEERLH